MKALLNAMISTPEAPFWNTASLDLRHDLFIGWKSRLDGSPVVAIRDAITVAYQRLWLM